MNAPRAASASSGIDYSILLSHITAVRSEEVYDAIVNAPFIHNKVAMAWLFLGFICLYLVDENGIIVQLMAMSDTEQYRLAVEGYNFNPADYVLDFVVDKNNPIVQSITIGEPCGTRDWAVLGRSNVRPETVRLNQASSGIAYSVIYPLSSGRRGGVMYNYYQYPDGLGAEQQVFMECYTKLVSEYWANE
jgi:hypothetical protein